MKYAGSYRSRARVPALTYLHPINNCSITRCSQPLVGVRNNRSAQDEKLVAAIFASSKPSEASSSLSSSLSTPGAENASPEESSTDLPATNSESFVDTEALEDEAIARIANDSGTTKRVYGAQQNNLIVDARPTVNAYANMAAGMGSENMDNYKFATKAFLGIDNIHVMRDSLNKVIDALKDSDVTPMSPNREQLARSGWLKHIMNLLDGASLIARQVGIHHSHVLIHCSDGWDRTSQLSALSQLCLDPYYRTLDGFITLIEKDWLSFGHMFRHRSGHLSSEKWFEIENERVGGKRNVSNGPEIAQAGGENAFQNAFLKAKGFFNKENDSKESLADSDGETQPYDTTPGSAKRSGAKAAKGDDKMITKVKETSPVFHQFLDATYQLLYQHPTRFEFNERFLRRLLYHLYSCQYGTFLYDNEKQRLEARVSEKTRSVWDYFLSRRQMWLNDKYESDIDDNVKGKERLLFPKVEDVRWWEELFGHKDMNAPLVTIAPVTAQSFSPYQPSTPARAHSRSPSGAEVSEAVKTHSRNISEVQSSKKPNGATAQNGSEHVPRPPVLTGLETSEEVVGEGAIPPHVQQMEREPSPNRSGMFNTSKLSDGFTQGASGLAAGLASLGIGKAGGSPAQNRGKSPGRTPEDGEVEMQ